MMMRAIAAGAALALGGVVLVGCGNEGEGVDPASIVPTTSEVYSRAGIDVDTGVSFSVAKDGVATIAMTQNRPALSRALYGAPLTLTCERRGADAVSTTFTWPRDFSSTQAALRLTSVKNLSGCTLASADGTPRARVTFST